jgi:hypothetical protein
MHDPARKLFLSQLHHRVDSIGACLRVFDLGPSDSKWFRRQIVELKHAADCRHIADHRAALGALVDADALDLAERHRFDWATGSDGVRLQHGSTS